MKKQGDMKYLKEELEKSVEGARDALTRATGELSAFNPSLLGTQGSAEAVDDLLVASSTHAVFLGFLRAIERGEAEKEDPEVLYRRLARSAISQLSKMASNTLNHSTSGSQDNLRRYTVAALGALVGLFMDVVDPL